MSYKIKRLILTVICVAALIALVVTQLDTLPKAAEPVRSAVPESLPEPSALRVKEPIVALLPQADMQPFLDEHCISCHGPEKEKGDLRLDTVAWTLDTFDTVQVWQHVLEALQEGEMPPEEEPRPASDQLSAFIQSLDTQLELAALHIKDRPETAPVNLDADTDEVDHVIHTELATAQPTNIERSELEPFIEANCIACHGPEKQKGEVRFDTMSWQITNNDEAQRWQDVLDVLNAGEMPPEEEPRPEEEALLNTLNSLNRTIVTARKRLTDHGGEITMRRLNRREYANTIHDLFGLKLSVHALPEDDDAETYDTIGADQFFSSIHFDRYLSLGTKIAQEGFKWSNRPLEKPKTKQHEPESVTKNLRKSVSKADEQMAMVKAGKTWQEIGFADAGAMKIFTSQYKGRNAAPRKYISQPNADTGQYIYNNIRSTDDIRVTLGNDPRGTYRIKIHAGVVDGSPAVRQFLNIRDESPLGVIKVEGTERSPRTIEILSAPSILSPSNRPSVTISECSPYESFSRAFATYLEKIQSDNTFASIWVDWVEVEGPFYFQKENFFGQLLSPKGQDLAKPARARELITQFAYEAFRRRPPEPEYINQLVAFFEQRMRSGQKYQDAMSETLGVVLTSPSFIFIEETPQAPSSRQLDARAFAIRLAYFLWSCPPDDELYRVAENGSIFEPNALKKQIRRMLNDRKADAFYSGFMSQWAELDRFEAISVDQHEYYRFNPGIRDSAYKEVIEFFKVLVKENLPVHNLIDSNFVVVNAHLANHYGFKGVDSNEFQKVSIPANSSRGGLITQTAFLTIGSNGERSSPVIRGTMVLDKILNDPPPPPPPNVPELGSTATRQLTNRQMVELHQKQTVCASCHSRIDPIGFGMENYDAIGQWRYEERVGDEALPIEQGGKLVSGMHYQDINDLKRLLTTQKHKLAKGIIESMLSYGLGRTIEFSDHEQIDELVQRCQHDDYGMQTMIFKVVTSPMFTTK
ncbi:MULTISPECIES: DUF1592 domain-containing protein [unclassified Lentimonas]|uniref:DUF1592 domain-containing protein n=1 Tax=unclassified Lentimonas TaxID=2630993 RepID=UPI00132BCB06|nr:MULTISPECIES: DUF1592 domain-containing protein [unclassified Lentimonas]CAA6676253.1 Unannotated [Lentimonas sp. CC4]CAA6683860.1 Unannotated [Lentimonas sp. CC6]CAA7077743.1 Unannotated [Lentimonas sp. CC4]CAA7169678.1 Unannotated [Lentimonas sp. CC21]CAA7179499.1 Unannotated [Lentimonas sp. CC8]